MINTYISVDEENREKQELDLIHEEAGKNTDLESAGCNRSLPPPKKRSRSCKLNKNNSPEVGLLYAINHGSTKQR